MKRTFVLIKPDGVKRGHIGEIISFYERKDLKITHLKMLTATKEIATKHYEELKDKPFFGELVEYICSSPLCALIIEGENPVEVVRQVNGATDPLKADMGSIRGVFGVSKGENLVHGSDSYENAEREIGIWFPEI